MLPLQALWNVFLIAGTDLARFQCTFAVVHPKWAALAQIDLVEPEIVFVQQALQPRIDFIVVEVVNRVDIATAIVNGTLELKSRRNHLYLEPFIAD